MNESDGPIVEAVRRARAEIAAKEANEAADRAEEMADKCQRFYERIISK